MAAATSTFSPGQTVHFSPDGYADASTSGPFTVTRVLPRDQDGWHYHIQSLHDRHVRRAHERQLSAMRVAEARQPPPSS